MSGNTDLERKIVVYDKHDADVSVPLSLLLPKGFRKHHNINNKKVQMLMESKEILGKTVKNVH